MFPGTETRIKVLLNRFGKEAVINRRGDGSTDKLNHSSGTYSMVGTALCAKFYAGDNGSSVTGAGEFQQDDPVLAFPLGTDVRPDDRITYGTTDYEVESLTERNTHLIASTKAVQ